MADNYLFKDAESNTKTASAKDEGSGVLSPRVTIRQSGSDVSSENPLSVSVSTSALPTGAATSAKQPALDDDGGALTHVTNFPETQAISVSALPLPSGAATSEKQPAIDEDGGALTHVTNFPETQTVSGEVSANITKVGGGSFSLGQKLASESIPVTLPADGVEGSMFSIAATLSGTPGTVTTIELPDSAQGVRIYPRSYPCQFSFGEDTPEVQATSSSTTIDVDDFSVGATAKNDVWETRLIAPGESRTLKLVSSTGSVVVDVEVF